jgi:hypothetical protein
MCWLYIGTSSHGNLLCLVTLADGHVFFVTPDKATRCESDGRIPSLMMPGWHVSCKRLLDASMWTLLHKMCNWDQDEFLQSGNSAMFSNTLGASTASLPASMVWIVKYQKWRRLLSVLCCYCLSPLTFIQAYEGERGASERREPWGVKSMFFYASATANRDQPD